MFASSKEGCCLHGWRVARLTALAFVLGAGVIAISGPARAADCQNTPEGRICKVRQPIAAGAVVGTATQRELGLVTVNGGCSGTLISQFLVLTARHCVTENGQVGGPLHFASNVTVTAAWAPGTTATVNSIQDFKRNRARDDIILLRLGWPNFGAVAAQRIYTFGLRDGGSLKLSGRLRTSDQVTQYGRGFSTFASGTFGTPSARQSGGIDTFRSARFTPSSITATGYELVMNSGSQVGHGGDSGGPTVVTDATGFNLGIAGVQSTCTPTGYITNTPANQRNWSWATGASACQYIATEPYLTEISDARRENAPADNRELCKAYAARQFAKVEEARRLGCAFLKGSGGWNKEEAAYEKSCLGDRNSAASTARVNETSLQKNLDRCKAPTVGQVCMGYAEMMVDKGKRVVGTKCAPLANYKSKEMWLMECSEGLARLPGRPPYDMNMQSQLYEGQIQNCLLSLKAAGE